MEKTAANPVAETPVEALDSWPAVLRMTGTASVQVYINSLTIRDLYRLGPGTVVRTGLPDAGNVPVRFNGRLIAWGEFQLVGNRLAVRIAEIA
ncbi:MAG TPA: FliM/FliN family flagellar motor C-terminal domain-containing protein [Candidatus Binatia bacterium]|nr:FliM/FliN family flagellar motor C-terminal domain-containing protein [Candidatus Binatia bacterium]